MRYRKRLRLHPHHGQYEEAIRSAGVLFGQEQYREALAVYERFLAEHPEVYAEEIQHRAQVLRGYITEHIESGPPAPPEGAARDSATG